MLYILAAALAVDTFIVVHQWGNCCYAIAGHCLPPRPHPSPSLFPHVQSSILGHLAKAGLLGGRRLYIEFGAGKGKLLFLTRRAVGADSPAGK